MKTPGLGSKCLCFGPLSVPKKRLAGVVSREIMQLNFCKLILLAGFSFQLLTCHSYLILCIQCLFVASAFRFSHWKLKPKWPHDTLTHPPPSRVMVHPQGASPLNREGGALLTVYLVLLNKQHYITPLQTCLTLGTCIFLTIDLIRFTYTSLTLHPATCNHNTVFSMMMMPGWALKCWNIILYQARDKWSITTWL